MIHSIRQATAMAITAKERAESDNPMILGEEPITFNGATIEFFG